MESRIDRRQLLVGAGAGSLALAALAVPTVSAAASGGNDSLEGGWLITRQDLTPTPSGPIQAVVTFAGGGAFACLARESNFTGKRQSRCALDRQFRLCQRRRLEEPGQ